ncbi:hypothetical protein BDF21DRAFT_349216, partial [Thamnidium elegans]
ICSDNTIDTIEHFIYRCPVNYTIWSTIWTGHFSTPCSLITIQKVIFHLDIPPTINTVLLPGSVIISCALLSIWRSHCQFIFDDIPFTVQTILAAIRDLLDSALQEFLLSEKQSPLPSSPSSAV